MKKLLTKPWIFFIALLLGVAVVVVMVKSKPAIEHNDTGMPPTAVMIETIREQPFQARVIAYGNVKPSIEMQAKAEVSGKISYLHPRLKAGNSLKAGEIAVRIDPEDFKVSLKQSEADLAANKSSLNQLRAEEAASRSSLELARENLEVGEKELARIQEIFDRKLVSRSSLDAEGQRVIQLRQQVQELEGQISIYASRRAATNAQISRAQQQVKGQQTTLGRTEVTMPFNGRIGNVPIEIGEFVGQGSELFEAINSDGVEIQAQATVQQVSSLFMSADSSKLDISSGDLQSPLAKAGLKARVKLVGTGEDGYREGEVVRMGEAMDQNRRTLSLVVAVKAPYSDVVPGRKPPLIKGMFTEVELMAPAIKRIVIPRRAIHQGRVYLVAEDNTLEIRPVEVGLLQGDLAVIRKGLTTGERIVVSDLMPVIPAMPLKPAGENSERETAEAGSKK